MNRSRETKRSQLSDFWFTHREQTVTVVLQYKTTMLLKEQLMSPTRGTVLVVASAKKNRRVRTLPAALVLPKMKWDYVLPG